MIDDSKVTLDSILSWLQENVEKQNPISKQTWLDAAAKMNILVSDLDDEVSELKFKLDRAESKRRRVTEAIRISKKRVDLFEVSP